MRKVVSATMLATAVALITIAGNAAVATTAHADVVFLVCPSGHSGVATGVTSCAFAENVRQSYLSEGGATEISAYSPVTGQYYAMECMSGFIANTNNAGTVPSVRCVGGNNAVVIIF